MIRTARTALRHLRRGAIIRKGQWGVPWYLTFNGARRRKPMAQSVFVELRDASKIKRTDDRSSRVGETWELQTKEN